MDNCNIRGRKLYLLPYFIIICDIFNPIMFNIAFGIVNPMPYNLIQYHMKHFTLNSLAISVLSLFSFGANAQETCLNGRTEGFGQTPPIHVEGNKLVDECGNQVVLHGVMDTPNNYFNSGRWNLDWTTGAYSSPSAIPNVKEYFHKLFTALGSQDKGVYCNIFRLHMDPCWTNDPNISSSGKENDITAFSKERLKYHLENLYFPLAKDAIEHGMYVIMRPPGVCPEEIKVGDAYNEYLKTVWDIVSSNDSIKKYAGVISLELANEPVRIYDKNGVETAQAPWAPRDFFQPVLDVIRKNGYQGIIWGSGTGYQSQYGGYKDYPLNDPLKNLGFAVHVYSGWYGNADEYGSEQGFIDQFKKQVPVVETHPIVVTECDWSPGHVIGTNFDGSLKSENLGTWATASTSKWGVRFKAVMDKYNLSLTLTGTDDYIDTEHYLKTGELRYAFYGKEGAEDACGKACWDWYKEYAKVNYPQFCAEALEPIDCQGYFPLTRGCFNPNIWESGSYNYKTQTLVTGQYGFGGWKYDQPIDLSGYEKIIVTLEKPCNRAASFRLFDESSYWSTPYAFDFSDSETVAEIKLGECMKGDSGEKLDPSHIYIAGFWTLGGGDGVQIKSIELVKKNPTSLVNVSANGDVLNRSYISPLGTVSEVPLEGMNIVRTVYENGAVVITKEYLNK